MILGRRIGVTGLGLLLLLWAALASANSMPGGPAAPSDGPLLQLGRGDQVKMEFFGRTEMDTTTYVADDGSVSVPLAGAVVVAGLSPAEAAKKVETALRDGQYLVDPHVTFTVIQSRSQRVSVEGEVRTPGRYPIESNTTVLDLLAEAGGFTEKSADIIYIIRQDANGNVQRYPVNLKSVIDAKDPDPSMMQTLRSGDKVVLPSADQISIAGEVHAPGRYRLEAGMTVLEAIAHAGGVTERGSTSRVDIKRRSPSGKYITISGKPGVLLEREDVITVKERIF
jgi:polysaccharide export outer membrane protein